MPKSKFSKPKRILTLLEWLEVVTKRTERKILTVPSNITKLPCGCARKLNDEPFQIRKERNYWVHQILSRRNHYVYRHNDYKKNKTKKEKEKGSFFVKSSVSFI